MILSKQAVHQAIYNNQIFSTDNTKYWKYIQNLVDMDRPLTEILDALHKLQSNLRALGADDAHLEETARRFKNVLRNSLVARIEDGDQCEIVICDLPYIKIAIDRVEVQKSIVYLVSLTWVGRGTFPPEQLSPHKIAEQAIKMLDWET